MGNIVDVEADEELSPCDIASFRIDFNKFEGCVEFGWVWPTCSKDVLACKFEVCDPRAWLIVMRKEFVWAMCGVRPLICITLARVPLATTIGSAYLSRGRYL
jgi:hypothetical protein